MDLILQCLLFLHVLFANIHHSSTTIEADPFHYNEQSGRCWLHYSKIGLTSRRTGNYTNMVLEFVPINETSRELFDNLTEGVQSLTITNSIVDTVYLPQNLIFFRFVGTEGCTTEIFIDVNATYKLEEIFLQILAQLPQNLDKLRRLKTVYCNTVTGGSIDLQVFNKMAHLKSISLQNCASVTISGSLELPSLEELAIGSSPVKFSTEASCNMPRLKSLSFYGTNLQEIPDHFSSFTNMKRFSMARNNLQRVTLEVFATMSQLEILILVENQITELVMQTQSLLELPRLRRLYLNKNNLTELNVTLWRIPVLDQFEFSQNQLQQVPGLMQLFATKSPRLSLRDNPWDCDWLNATVQGFPEVVLHVSRNDLCGTVVSEGP